ncbi:MAG: FkbM family methyltransferase [Sphingomicrobium sp.]
MPSLPQMTFRRTTTSARRSSASVIYDFGMNNGDDVEYYLLKCDRVVGVEANASLCEQARERFAKDIASGRLSILNVALSERASAAPLTFYIHKTNHVLSQLPEPADDVRDEYEPVLVPCRTPSSIIREFGPPLYIKVDIEYYDHHVLRELFAARIFPPDISAESHSIGIFACLVENGYTYFSLVDGQSVSETYGDATISTATGDLPFSFPEHSAGPYGDDIRAPWEDADSFFQTLATAGLGWKDIHASRRLRSADLAEPIVLAET